MLLAKPFDVGAALAHAANAISSHSCTNRPDEETKRDGIDMVEADFVLCGWLNSRVNVSNSGKSRESIL